MDNHSHSTNLASFEKSRSNLRPYIFALQYICGCRTRGPSGGAAAGPGSRRVFLPLPRGIHSLKGGEGLSPPPSALILLPLCVSA
jgi:hypothetical protein